MDNATESDTPSTTTDAPRVLLVEDNANNRRIVQALLKRLRITPTIDEDGAAAVNAFKYGSFDLILMDIQMPNMEGLEASRRIREIEYQESRGRTPIVAVTANSMPEDRDACERAGMDYFLAKPLRCEPFLNAVDQWLHCEQEREVATSANVTQVPETIDWSDLARLGRDIGPEVIPELVENFSQDLSESNALLDEYLAAGQIEDLTRLAHTPKGLRCNLWCAAAVSKCRTC
jgi:CheY-like chemotaxis protein